MSQSGRPLNQVKLQVQTQVARLQSICEQHGDISIEAVYLLAWTILLQKYRAKEHDLFAWRCHRGFQFNHWQQAIDPGRDVLASLREASKGYQARKSYSTDGSVADTVGKSECCCMSSYGCIQLQLYAAAPTLFASMVFAP
jgi:hypothetical protein